MKRSILVWLWLVAAMLVITSRSTLAQDATADPTAKQSAAEAAKAPAPQEAAAKPSTEVEKKGGEKTLPIRSPYRPLAPWIMQTIDPMRSLGETVSYHNAVNILAVDPSLSWAKDVSYRHDVWTLEFKFKPMRMIWVDEPHAGGHMERKLIWYMVYSVTNLGKVYHPTEDVDLPYDTAEKRQIYQVKEVDQPVRFLPEFLLDTYQRQPNGALSNKCYPDRVIPVAMAAVQLREDPNRPFLSTVDMCREIKVGETLWGIATWEDIDPTTFKFSVYVSGLTNAYRWKDDPKAIKAGDDPLTGRKLSRRTLKLNFWRPADKYLEREEEIRYGVPGGVDYEWVYR